MGNSATTSARRADRQTKVAVGATGTRRWAALAVLCVSILVVNLDNTILNVALPTLVRKLMRPRASCSGSSTPTRWCSPGCCSSVAASPTVRASAPLPARARALRGGLGRRGLLGLGRMLIAWRGVMGAGAALTMPVDALDHQRHLPGPRERSRAIGLWAGTSGIGIAIGPIAGGLLLARFWWGSVFFVNVPIVIAGALAALVFVPDSKDPDAPGPIRPAALLSIPASGSCSGRSSRRRQAAGRRRGSSWSGWRGLAVLALFVAWEARSDHPMLQAGGSSAAALLGGDVVVVARCLRPVRRAVRADPVPAVRPSLLADRRRSADPSDRSGGRRDRAVVGARRPLLRQQARRRLPAWLAIGGGLLEVALVASPTTRRYADVVGGMILIGLGAAC